MPATSSPDISHWMRDQFPQLNTSIDSGNQSDLDVLLFESLAAFDREASSTSLDEREWFTYLSMIHAALFHHKKRAWETHSKLPSAFSAVLERTERAMTLLAEKIGVEHRFLSAFYLFHNPEIPDMQGKFAQFRTSDYETAFIRINKEGTLQFKVAAQALGKVYTELQHGTPSKQSILSFMNRAEACFRKISHGNSMLLNTPGGEEFRFLTQYFGEVEIGGKKLRGVNAGDQPWSYIIDLLLGVDLKHVFERAFVGTEAERHYPVDVKTTADVIHYEFHSGEYLHANYLLPEDYGYMMRILERVNEAEPLTSRIEALFGPSDQRALFAALEEGAKHYLAASNVHFQLAKRYVPAQPNGEQIGSAGTNIVRFLRDGLNAERENVKQKLETKRNTILESA
ncbi:MAG TPA: monodechloroaminopyrrolnitrin synthase PrnB family protein [Candidatus Kapabacteria bacterium]|jgi:hypothetical protein